MRRCGKSSILILLKEEILSRGVLEEQVIYLNFESFNTSNLGNSALLYEHVKEKITKGQRTYIFLDEIQEVQEWEKAVNSFLVDFDVDVGRSGRLR